MILKEKSKRKHYRSILKKYFLPNSLIRRYNIYFKISARFYNKKRPLHHGSFWYYLSQSQWDNFVDQLLEPMIDSLKTSESLFEVGMGCGAALKRIEQRFENLSLSGLDPEKKAITLAKSNLKEGNYFVGNGLNIKGVQDNTYDIIISNCVIIYLKNLNEVQKFCEEIIRVAKPNAKILITGMIDINGKHMGTGNIRIPKSWWYESLTQARVDNLVTIGDLPGCEHQKDRYAVYLTKT